MPEHWTGEILCEMHLHKVTAKRLAAEIGWHEKYLSAVLNGRRTPKGGESKARAALTRIVQREDDR